MCFVVHTFCRRILAGNSVSCVIVCKSTSSHHCPLFSSFFSTSFLRQSATIKEYLVAREERVSFDMFGKLYQMQKKRKSKRKKQVKYGMHRNQRLPT